MCAYIRSRIRNYVPNLTFRFYPYPSHRIPLDELPFRVRMYLVMMTIKARSYLKTPKQSASAFPFVDGVWSGSFSFFSFSFSCVRFLNFKRGADKERTACRP